MATGSDFFSMLLGQGLNLAEEGRQAVADRGRNLAFLGAAGDPLKYHSGPPGLPEAQHIEAMREQVRSRYFLEQARKAKRIAQALRREGADDEEIRQTIHDLLQRHVGDVDPAYDPEADRIDVWQPIAESKRGGNAGGASLAAWWQSLFGR